MKCPFCLHLEDRVVDSRESREGDVIRRRRECLKCERRFTSYERIDEIPYMVVKKDGTRAPFSRNPIAARIATVVFPGPPLRFTTATEIMNHSNIAIAVKAQVRQSEKRIIRITACKKSRLSDLHI